MSGKGWVCHRVVPVFVGVSMHVCFIHVSSNRQCGDSSSLNSTPERRMRAHNKQSSVLLLHKQHLVRRCVSMPTLRHACVSSVPAVQVSQAVRACQEATQLRLAHCMCAATRADCLGVVAQHQLPSFGVVIGIFWGDVPDCCLCRSSAQPAQPARKTLTLHTCCQCVCHHSPCGWVIILCACVSLFPYVCVCAGLT